jgi:hypothetical protein
MIFIEDLFLSFYNNKVLYNSVILSDRDLSSAIDFAHIIHTNRFLTEKQGKYITYILKRYNNEDLSNAKWKMQFRVLDTEKKIWIENSLIHMKFPYSRAFIEEFPSLPRKYDAQMHCIIFSPYVVSIFKLLDFVSRHKFIIDTTFYEMISYFESVYNDVEDLIPHSTIIDGTVYLINASTDAQEYFDLRKNNNVNHDLLLAKDMNFLYNLKPTTGIERIAASEENTFWITNYEKFFDLCLHVDGKICIVLDDSKLDEWVTVFLRRLKFTNFDINDIGIYKKKYNSIQVDGTVVNLTNNYKDKKIIIFHRAPEKWIFEKDIHISIIATNWIYPSPNIYVKEWMVSHPLVCYLGDIKPTSKIYITKL